MTEARPLRPEMADSKRYEEGGEDVAPEKDTTHAYDRSGEVSATGSQTTRDPRHLTLNTVELLENIIVHLPAKTIFGIQRVCCRFRDVIESSTPIQEKLFLRLRGEEPVTWITREQDPSNTRARQRCRIPPSWTRTVYEPNFVLAKKGCPLPSPTGPLQACVPASLNPLLYAIDSREQPLTHRYGALLPVIRDTAHFHDALRIAPEASWRKTFLSDPPCKSAWLWHTNAWRPRQTGGFTSSEGVTLGELIDAVIPDAEEDIAAYIAQNMVTSSSKDYLDTNLPPRCRIVLNGMVLPTEEDWRDTK